MRTPRLILAPMHGVTDKVMRQVLTDIGGVDLSVTEFIRITSQLLPKHTILKSAPELEQGSRTPSGTPVFVQLLGGDAQCLMENALHIAEMGALGIDLNFGCPAKTVNRHDGGATLLQYPSRILDIVSRIRKYLPEQTPLTVKMRLGFMDTHLCLENALAAQEGGARWLTVHARTKQQMYTPPAHWHLLPALRESLKIPLIANGEIWNEQDAAECRRVTGCDSLMIGRGVLADPFLIRKLALEENNRSWSLAMKVLAHFFDLSSQYRTPLYALARTKQWLSQMRRHYPEAASLFEKIKSFEDPAAFRGQLQVDQSTYSRPLYS